MVLSDVDKFVCSPSASCFYVDPLTKFHNSLNLVLCMICGLVVLRMSISWWRRQKPNTQGSSSIEELLRRCKSAIFFEPLQIILLLGSLSYLGVIVFTGVLKDMSRVCRGPYQPPTLYVCLPFCTLGSDACM
jgi:hypothetical protein